MANLLIKNGATVWARQTIDSDIFFYKPDKWFKIWFFIVNKVNYKDGNLFKRGEGLITYEDIMAQTRASKAQTHKCIKFLEKENMLASRRTTRGMIRIVLKYEEYQTLQNYKGNSKTTTETTDGQLTDNLGVLPITKESKIRKESKISKQNIIINNNASQEILEKPVKVKKIKKAPDMRITKMLEALKIWTHREAFSDSKFERNIGLNLVRLFEKIGKEEFLRRLNLLLNDDFKAKNCNSVTFIYNQLKSFPNKITQKKAFSNIVSL